MAENIIISFPNRITGATLSGGSWEASLPLDNLKKRLISKVARSTDATLASTQFNVDLGAPYPVRVVGLINHNISLTGLWRIRAFDADSPPTTVYDSGWLYAWLITGSAWDIDLLEWELENYWLGSYTLEEITGITPLSIHVVPSVAKIAQEWLIEIDDQDNDADYIQVGRLFFGPGWQPSINYSAGAGLGLETDTLIEKSLGGVEFFETRETLRGFQFDLDALTLDEGFGAAFELIRRAGLDKEVIFIPDPDDEEHALRRRFMGRLTMLPQILQPYHDHTSVRFEAKELR